MSTRKIIIWSLLICLIGFGVGYVLTNSTQYKICVLTKTITDASCINFYERLGDPLFYGMLALASVFTILFFTPQAFLAWKKFAKWAIPIMALIFIFYPDPGSGDYFSPYPEQVFRWVSVLYVVASILIILKSSKKE